MTAPDNIVSHFGLDAKEIEAATALALTTLVTEPLPAAMAELFGAHRDGDKPQRDAVRMTSSSWMAEFGTATLIMMQQQSSNYDWPAMLKRLLAYPIAYRDWADWWLLFSALDAQVTFQTVYCPAKKREARLTGHLLTELKASSAKFAEPVKGAIKRADGALSISEIDLEIGGGEQSTGGDFGLILDFDSRSVQPADRKGLGNRRIVPMLFQAKRYKRPMADVSQTHATRGPQRDMLATNACAAAYIFYENLGNPAIPLPPLVKSVDRVPFPTETNALEDSLDFATYLLTAATNEVAAPRAPSPEMALRMIFAKAAPEDVSTLVVISSDPEAKQRYRSALDMVRHMMAHEDDQRGEIHEEK